MTLRFLHLTPQIIDQLCREEKIVEIELSIYDANDYVDSEGTKIHVEKKLSSYKARIRSFEDLIQYDNKDALFLAEKDQKELI
jgi:hypothetical protein